MNEIAFYLEKLKDQRKDLLLDYNQEKLHLIKKAKGSSNNHQSWIGGYEDHVLECFKIAYTLFSSLKTIRPLPFNGFVA